jgi:retron-type reverse transcriptase
MSTLANLKNAKTLHDVASILGFKPKSLAYILYKKSSEQKYNKFEIPKRSGGTRIISAPSADLKKLQSRLSGLLQDSISAINKAKNIESVLSHGFRRDYSIITNAAVHRNKRYVFNVDLENFFGAINFGRVRGFFIENNDFKLHPAVATILAQIACHENALPQGSPCSPVISNLIGHILDIRLAALAYKSGCKYSRYADDLTFSTNKSHFPAAVAGVEYDGIHQWCVGRELERIIVNTGFKINASKTRMQYCDSRQDVTGLIVNAKVNTRIEYRRIARAMVNNLLRTGKFQRKETALDKAGEVKTIEKDGNLNELNGVLSFIYKVGASNRSKHSQKDDALDSHEETYRQFLFFKDFYANTVPLIVCEGKTDNIYIKAAIRQLGHAYPQLAEQATQGHFKLKVQIYRYTAITSHLLDLSGGTGSFPSLIGRYEEECKRIPFKGLKHPVILLVDHDDGANTVYKAIKQKISAKASKLDDQAPFYFLGNNLYVVLTPLKDGNKTKIEDFFEDKVKQVLLGGKHFSESKSFDKKTQYGKFLFAEQVVKKHQEKINFEGFKPILDRLNAVLMEHPKNIPH